MDIALVLVFSPLITLVIAVVSGFLLLLGKPVFYSQMRVGRGGKPFRMWKFNTMVANADRVLETLLLQNPDAAREWQETRKLRHDPRVIRFGAFLRKSSLDELPQLWNVLRGDMSLVGPRPVTRTELADKYRGSAPAYLKCCPGITGLWQVSGRNLLRYSERVRLDVAYANRQNLWLDLQILWHTFGAVLRGTGC
jgi:lipopolysaccharide/colanic/teichoic acid biosynthesis glycosyltransferase